MLRKTAAAFSIRFALPVLVTLVAMPAAAQFVNRTGQVGLTWNQSTWGAAFSDLDGDGYLDLYVGHHVYLPRIFWNEGDGTFNANVHPQPWSGPTDRHGTLMMPLDQDGRFDVFVTHGGVGGGGTEANELFRNDGSGLFTSLPGGAGMSDPAGRTRCASGADFNHDLCVDLWVGKAPKVGDTAALFRNDGGTFVDVAAAAGLDEPEGAVGGIWGDYDDDLDPDLLVGGEEFPRPTRLWRNDGGVFADVSSVFSPPLPVVSGADWGDIDGDGDLDLAVCDGNVGVFDVFAEGDSVTFFFNTRYADSGVDGLTVPSTADTARAAFRYFAFPDNSLIFLGPSKANPPAGVVFLTDEYVGEPAFDPGTDLGTYVWRTAPGGDWEVRCSTPNVGYDVFDGWITDGTTISGVTPILLEDPGFAPGAPHVWRNDGGQFLEISASLGLPAAMLNPRDVSLVDYDNDGDLDLHVVDMGTSAAPNAPDALFRNDGAVFTDVTTLEGVAGGANGLGDGAVWGDTDRDGDLDLFVAQGAGPLAFSGYAPALFLENQGNRGQSIQLDLVGRAPNAAAVGTRVTAVTPTKRVLRRVAANAWRGFQDPLRVHLGLGDDAVADSLILRWPDGRVDVYVEVPAGIYRLKQGVPVVGVPNLSVMTDPGWRVIGPRPQPARGPQRLEVVSGRAADLTVCVYDIAGRKVRTLHHGVIGAGATSLLWDGRDAGGRGMAAGVYLLRIGEDGGPQVTVRSVRIR